MIAEDQRIGQIITAELSFKNLRALGISLYKERHGEDSGFQDLRKLMKRAGQLESKRNVITHSTWGAGDCVASATRFKTTAKESGGLRFKFEKLGEQELKRIAHEMKILTHDITRFWIDLIEQGKAVNNPFKRIW